MKIKSVGREDVGEVIDFYWNEDGMMFRVIWYGRPGIHDVLSDYVEVVK